ncbi:hypothetical protein ACFU8W_51205 [Streptomyces sp. NPDC057565]|uniref:hypothetical protein n=1 Tax=Streptomyces sp. NPDC057565 TaxID=3346169 RepID=UPI0036C5C862
MQQQNLARAVEAGIAADESEETMERIRIDVWPAKFAPVQVLKQWSAWTLAYIPQWLNSSS